MILRFFCRPLPNCAPGPLLAEATIPPESIDSPDTTFVGVLTFFYPDTTLHADHFEHWKRWLEYFYRVLESELHAYITVRHHPLLKPWSRLAFENIGKYGINGLGHVVVAKLYEDDGTEWDPSTSIPLYGPNPGPFGKSGEVKIPTTSNMRTKGRINPPRPQTEDAGSAEDQTAG